MSTKAERLRGRLSINPDELTAPTPAPARRLAVQPEPPVEAAPAPEAATEAPVAPPKPAAAPKQAKAPRKAPKPETAAQRDVEGESGYRSFYVDNAVYARFRAAIFWASRDPEGINDVPQNMSDAMERAMATMAEDLESRFNAGKPYPEPPETGRRRRKTGA